VGLLFKQKAEIIQEGEGEVRSSSSSLPTPKIIRLVYMVKVPYSAKVPLNRRAVIARDHGLCQYCFKPGDTIDHVKPKAKGGRHIWENVVTACKACNALKADKTLQELGWALRSKPYAPMGTNWLILAVAKIDESWEPYLNLKASPALVG